MLCNIYMRMHIKYADVARHLLLWLSGETLILLPITAEHRRAINT